MDEHTLNYLCYIFYYYEMKNKMLSDKYNDRLHHGGKLIESFNHLFDGNYIKETVNQNWELTQKGKDYLFRHLPFNELWALYRDEIIK